MDNTLWKPGWAEIGGERKYYRSKWESNYGRYLQFLLKKGLISGWRHEIKTFWFLEIKRGIRSYLPDFEVQELNGDLVYHEVKGFMDSKSKTKIKRMKIYYPKVKLIVIEKKNYRDIENKLGRMISGWEF